MALVGTPTWFSMLVFLAFVTMPALIVSTPEVAAPSRGYDAGYLWYVTAHTGSPLPSKSVGYFVRLKRPMRYIITSTILETSA